ncbi:hypothetical protein LE190_11340 [Massilia oculi]|uniref:Uncharacterized protein n=1 Tax=Massilia hydrophila TaxID=3044279 RepID=A0ABS7YA03_9BURK|nr:hypothetical protein [Massilia oculi]MCA1856508.1 hypothetical protein [Massilia oculi]
MNIRKNFEAIFLTAAALGLVASYATAAARPVEILQASSAVMVDSTVHVVVVKAPRLSVAEKAGLQ